MTKTFSSVEDAKYDLNPADLEHLYDRHLNASLNYLRRRRCEMASSFVIDGYFDMTLMRTLVLNGLAEETPIIGKWLADYSDGVALYVFVDMPPQWHGICWLSGERRFVDCDEIVVVLCKGGKGFYIPTIYPCNSDNEPQPE